MSSRIRINKFAIKDSIVCDRKGWLTARHKEEHTLKLLTLFQQGKNVEKKAIEQLGKGITMPHDAKLALQRTNVLATNDLKVFQPAFEIEGIILRPDVVNTSERSITEIKSSTKLKPDYILDVGISVAAAKNSGIAIEKMNLMHVNGNYRIENDELLMVTSDITDEVEQFLSEFDLVSHIESMKSATTPPAVLKKSCKNCQFIGNCFNSPEELIINIPRINAGKVASFVDSGIQTMSELRDDEDLFNSLTEKQRDSIDSYLAADENIPNNADICMDSLNQAPEWLKSMNLIHFDFETSGSAIPTRVGEKPWQQAVTQFSVTIDDGNTLKEIGFLSDGTDDREALVKEMIKTCNNDMSAPIVVYNASFEKARISELSNLYPKYSAELVTINDRIVDLLPITKSCMPNLDNHKLKTVAPLLDNDFSYDKLKIKNGSQADSIMTLLRIEGGTKVMLSKTGLTIESARIALLEYCANDTMATAIICRHFKKLLGDKGNQTNINLVNSLKGQQIGASEI